MYQETAEDLKSTLVAVLERDGQKAAYWKTHFTIRMSDEAGALLYDILDKKNGGWVDVKNSTRLNGCQCTTARIIKKTGEIYRNFQPCSLHAPVIIDLLERAKISSLRPEMKAVKAVKSQKPKKNRFPVTRFEEKGSGIQSLIKVRNTKKKKKPGRTCVTNGSDSDIPRNFHEKSSGLMNNVKSKDH